MCACSRRCCWCWCCWYCCYLLEMAVHSCNTTLWAILGGRGCGVWQYQKTFTRYPSNSKTNVKNRCPELGAGAGIGPVTPASQRKDQDVMLRLLKSMETIVCQWSSNSFCENSVCPPWCLMFVFWNLRKSAKVTSALQTVSQRCRWTCMEIRYQCNAINTDKKSKWNMSEMERWVFDVFNMLCSPGIMENDIFYVATWNYPNRKNDILVVQRKTDALSLVLVLLLALVLWLQQANASVCPPWCLMFVFWSLRKSAKVTSALQTVYAMQLTPIKKQIKYVRMEKMGF